MAADADAANVGPGGGRGGGGRPAGVRLPTVGDLVQWCAVSTIEQATLANPTADHRSPIDHFSNETYETSRLRRLVDAGGIAAPQCGLHLRGARRPGQAASAARDEVRAADAEEHRRPHPRNSDTAAAQPFTCNPWFVIKCMIARENKNGVVIAPEQAVGIDDAPPSPATRRTRRGRSTTRES